MSIVTKETAPFEPTSRSAFHEIEPRASAPTTQRPGAITIPARFELLVAACLLLALATAASLPFGPGWDAFWRGILTFLASALTLVLLLAATTGIIPGDRLGLPIALHRLILAGGILFACASVLTFAAWGSLQLNAPSTQSYWRDVLTLRTPSRAAGARDRRGRAIGGGTGASSTETA